LRGLQKFLLFPWSGLPEDLLGRCRPQAVSCHMDRHQAEVAQAQLEEEMASMSEQDMLAMLDKMEKAVSLSGAPDDLPGLAETRALLQRKIASSDREAVTETQAPSADHELDALNSDRSGSGINNQITASAVLQFYGSQINDSPILVMGCSQHSLIDDMIRTGQAAGSLIRETIILVGA
jgi:hypothetical protein